MNRLLPFALIAAAFLGLSCTAVRAQKSLEAATDGGEFHNLQVLPPNISRDALMATMQGFTKSLGTWCDHCHVPTGDQREFDYASDAKPAKNAARAMIRMVRTINADYLVPMNPAAEPVTCMTCHRGKKIPETPAPAPG